MTPSTQPATAQSSHAGKYLTFVLANEEYGVEVLKVQEIIRLLPITPVPEVPPHFRGVINLRGKILPVVDLRSRFGLPPGTSNDESCIVVMRTAGTTRGVIVDRVTEVTKLEDAMIEPPPDLGRGAVRASQLGIGKVDGKIKLLLDIDHVLRDETEGAAASEWSR
jgi:purine-binding chemotaxis protein CheW